MWIPPKNLAAFKRFNSTFILWACLHIERSSIEFRRASVPKFMWPWTSQTSHRAVEYWTTQGKCNINILSWVGNFNETLTKAWENLERCKSSKDGWLWPPHWQCNLKCQIKVKSNQTGMCNPETLTKLWKDASHQKTVASTLTMQSQMSKIWRSPPTTQFNIC